MVHKALHRNLGEFPPKVLKVHPKCLSSHTYIYIYISTIPLGICSWQARDGISGNFRPIQVFLLGATSEKSYDVSGPETEFKNSIFNFANIKSFVRMEIYDIILKTRRQRKLFLQGKKFRYKYIKLLVACYIFYGDLKCISKTIGSQNNSWNE